MFYGKTIAFQRESQINIESLRSFIEKQSRLIESEKEIKNKLSQPGPIDRLESLTQKLGSAVDWNLSIQYLKIEEDKVEIKGLVEKSLAESFKQKLKSLAKKGRIQTHALFFRFTGKKRKQPCVISAPRPG